MFDITELSLELAEASQADGNHAILVAGQALSFWGHYYLDDNLPLDQLSPLASRDIDFYERKTALVKAYVKKIRPIIIKSGAIIKDAYYPDISDATFQTGLIEIAFPDNSELLKIDYLDNVDGLESSEIVNNADFLQVGEHGFWILNPCMCLKARIHNLLRLYPRLGKSQERMEVERQRVRLGTVIVKLYLEDLLYNTPNGLRKAHDRVRTLIRIARLRLGEDLLRQYDINILDAVPDKGLNARFYDFELKSAAAVLERKAARDYYPNGQPRPKSS